MWGSPQRGPLEGYLFTTPLTPLVAFVLGGLTPSHFWRALCGQGHTPGAEECLQTHAGDTLFVDLAPQAPAVYTCLDQLPEHHSRIGWAAIQRLPDAFFS